MILYFLHQVDWSLENGVKRCSACAEQMEEVQCSASKFVTKSEDSSFALVKHTGKHKCQHKSLLESQVLEEMESYFEHNPTATRSEAIVHHLVSKINVGTKQEVIDLVNLSLNIWEINN